MVEHVVFDLDMYGEKDSQGQVKKIYDSEALKQSFTKWIVSPKFSRIKSTSGGTILQYLGKQLSDDNAISFKRAIQDGLKNDFYPTIEPVSLSVTPDYANRKWKIKLIGYVPLFKTIFNYDDSVNNLGS